MASSKAKWESFFQGAGVPPRLSAEYAATFSTNRMRLDMLDELNKELLRDLGVKALGDIISILRYAKEKESVYKRRSPPVEDSPPTQPRTQAKIQSKPPIRSQARPQPARPQSAGPRASGPLLKTKPKTIVTAAKSQMAARGAVSSAPKSQPQPAQLKVVTTQKVGDSTATQRANLKVHNTKNTTVLNASSALSTARPSRQKLSERFHEFETETKRKRLSEEEAVTEAEVKQIRFADQVKARQQPQQIKQTITGSTTVASSTKTGDGGTKYIGVKVGDKIKLKAVPRTTQNTSMSRSPHEAREDIKNGSDSGPSLRTQFTVQVPSKQPGTGLDNKTPVVKGKPKVTVVPAQGKALNRAKPLTSIFDRLDAPSSSSTALSLLKKDDGKKDNVFKRLGNKTDESGSSPKTPIAVGVVRPAAVTARLGEKHNPDSVFNRLGSQSI